MWQTVELSIQKNMQICSPIGEGDSEIWPRQHWGKGRFDVTDSNHNCISSRAVIILTARTVFVINLHAD